MKFGKIEIIFDEQLLRSNIRQLILPLREEIKRFYTSTVWNQEFVDLEIPLNIQIVFEGATQKGSSQTFLAQALFSNGNDLRYFDKGVQFLYNDSRPLYYDPVIFDPLSSFLAFYGNLILAGEIDTYTPEGGTTELELKPPSTVPRKQTFGRIFKRIGPGNFWREAPQKITQNNRPLRFGGFWIWRKISAP